MAAEEGERGQEKGTEEVREVFVESDGLGILSSILRTNQNATVYDSETILKCDLDNGLEISPFLHRNGQINYTNFFVNCLDTMLK